MAEVAEKTKSEELTKVFGDKSSVHTEKAVKAPPSAPAVDEPKIEPKAEAKTEVKTEVKSEVKDEKQKEQEKEKVLLKEEKKPEAVKEEKPSVNWDDESNPYKKRYQDTANWTNRVNQENATIKKQLEMVNKKLDGTYDPEKDAPPTVSPDQEKANAELAGRIAASRAAAFKQFGQEKVEGMLNDFRAKYAENPMMVQRVMSAELPALEVITVLGEESFKSKYGNDPDTIYNNIKKEAEAELRARITDEVTKQFNERIQLKEKQPSGLSEVKGATLTQGEKPTLESPLTKLFGR